MSETLREPSEPKEGTGSAGGRPKRRKDSAVKSAAEPSLSELLMEEVERRVEARRREGLYGDDDDRMPFAQVALEDDLAAAANRLAVAARIPSIVPDLRVPAPHDARDDASPQGSSEGPEGEETRRPEEVPQPPPPASRVLLRTAYSAGRKVFRAFAGERIERFVDGSVEFFHASAAFAREATERILTLEQKVRHLEESLAAISGPTNALRGRAQSDTKSAGGGSTTERYTRTLEPSAAASAKPAKEGATAESGPSGSGSRKKSSSVSKSASGKKPSPPRRRDRDRD